MAFSFTFNSFCNNNANDMVDAVTFAPFAPLSSSAVCKNMQRVNRPSLMSQRTRTPNSFTQHYTLVCSYLLLLLLLGLLKQKTVTGALQLYQTTSHLAAERERRGEDDHVSLMRATCPDLSPRSASTSFTGSHSYSCLRAPHVC